MEKRIKQFLPQNFEVIDGIGYFRLKDGRIATERIDHVVIKSSKEDTVELVTLECGSEVVRLWKINDEEYRLLSGYPRIIIPKDTDLVECYFSTNDSEGIYVKCMSPQGCGIIYVSKKDAKDIISCKKGYTDICFENGLFYAESKEGNKMYHMIDASGELLGIFPSKCRQADGMFYDDDSIFVGSSKFDIPGGVLSLEVIKLREFTFVKVVNRNGIYYYTKGISFLMLGPIKNDKIMELDDKSCLIYEMEGKKITQMFYIGSAYECTKLSSQEGIKVDLFSDCNFFVADKVLYVAQDNDLVPLIRKGDISEYAISEGMYRYVIVGLQENIPVCLAYYESKKGLYGESTFEWIADGYEKEKGKISHICGSGDRIITIDHNGRILFSSKGDKCYKREYRGESIYVVEKGENDIKLYNKNGKEIIV